MRALVSASVFCRFILAGVQAGNPYALKKEIELLRGTWSVDVQVGGQEGKGRFAIYGDESFEINIAGAAVNGARTIDPAKNPRKSR